MESEFPSNSQFPKKKTEPRPEEVKKKEIKPVVTGEVITRKKPLGKRFMETFLGGDAKGVGSYVLFDVMIPAAKDMVADAVSQGVERTLFGEVRTTSRRGRGFGVSSFTAYNRMSDPRSPLSRREDPRERERASLSRRARATHNFDEIILSTRAEATEVLDSLIELISSYELATVADLYALVDQTPSFTDERWGWADLRGTEIIRTRHGYLLNLPRPEPIQ